jgi:hypothetical protein
VSMGALIINRTRPVVGHEANHSQSTNTTCALYPRKKDYTLYLTAGRYLSSRDGAMVQVDNQ